MTTNNTKNSDKSGNFNVDSNISSEYIINKRIGKGAYGIVYKAYDKHLKQYVAIKKIYDAFRNKTDAQRTYREILFLKSFQIHPNIITMLNLQRAKNNKDLYVVFEYMENDLNKVIREKILKDIHVRYIMFQLCNGLDYIHKCKVMHRDLKPCNILIDKNCIIKIGDLGLARSVSDGECLTEYIATRWYRAPEILMSNKSYTHYVDIWSLGCILAEMLLSKPLFPGSSTSEQLQLIVDKIRNKPPHSDTFSDLFKNQSEEVINLLSEILVLNPNNRPSASKILEYSFIRKYFPSKTHLVPNISPHPVVLDINDNDQLEISDYQNKLYGLIKNSKNTKSDKIIVKNKVYSNESKSDKNVIRIKDKTYSKYISNEKENDSKNIMSNNNKDNPKNKEKPSVEDDKSNIKMIITTNNNNFNERRDRPHLNEINPKKEKNYISYNKLNTNSALDKNKIKKIRTNNIGLVRKKNIEVGKETNKVKDNAFHELEGNENASTKAILVTSKIYNLDSIQHVNKKDIEKIISNIKENKSRVKRRTNNMEFDNTINMDGNERRYDDSKYQTVKRNHLKKHEKNDDFVVESKNKYTHVDNSNLMNENSIIDKIESNKKRIEFIERKIENYIYKEKDEENSIDSKENERLDKTIDSVLAENEQEYYHLKIHRNSYPDINLKYNKSIKLKIPNISHTDISHIDLTQTNMKYSNDILKGESIFRQNRTDSEKKICGRKFQSEQNFKQCPEDADQYKSEPNIHFEPIEPINIRNNRRSTETGSEVNSELQIRMAYNAQLSRIKDASSRNKSISNETLDDNDRKCNVITTKNKDNIRQNAHYSDTHIDQYHDISSGSHKSNYDQNEDMWYTFRNRKNMFNKMSDQFQSKSDILSKPYYDAIHRASFNSDKQKNGRLHQKRDLGNGIYCAIDKNQKTNSTSDKLLHDYFTDNYRNSMNENYLRRAVLNKMYPNEESLRPSSNIDFLLSDDIMQKYKQGINRIVTGEEDNSGNELSYCNGNHMENISHKESRKKCGQHRKSRQHLLNTCDNATPNNTTTLKKHEIPMNARPVLCNGINHSERSINNNNEYIACDTIRKLRNNNFNDNRSRNNCILSKLNKNISTKIKNESHNESCNKLESLDEILGHNQSSPNCRPNIFNCFKKNKCKMRKYCNHDLEEKLDSMYKLSELTFNIQPIGIVDSDDLLD